LSEVQRVVDAEAPGSTVLLAVNGIGFESGNDGFVMGKSLPLLQDVPTVDLWARWSVTYRDVIVVDASGRKRGVLNLTDNDLTQPANQQALLRLLRQSRQ
jgi:hypothetical protein